ncbi:GDSL esterase/lipase [Spatholobus suberectus]|nr:GDSL esterase/lipase [Spatholobus suberectus]
MANQVVPRECHPYAFHVSGPRKFTSLNWRDLIISSWKDANNKRTVIACFIQAVYLLEIDRQEKRTHGTALAPNWWIPFKYKPKQTLIDERDGSIFGAILEWDRSAALADLIPIRPSGAPRAVLALRGTLLKSPTMRRDIEDDLRFLAWESLKGSVRFKVALEVLKSICEKYGSNNVCIAGHSLGAGFALQVGKELAKEGTYVEAHLFNPPSVSLAMSLKTIGEKAEFVWNRLKSMLPSSSEAQISNDGDKTSGVGLKSKMPQLSGSGLKDASLGVAKWVPYLYVNNGDYICCSYNDGAGSKVTVGTTNGQVAAKLFVVSKEKQKFLEAHGLEQWWSSDAEIQQVIHNSKLISRQLRSLSTATPSQLNS